jgi:uncharacterized repeat protein (TIGR03803 family)
MNYARQHDKFFRVMAAFVAAMVVLTLAGVAIPAQAQTPTVIYDFPGGSLQPIDPDDWAIAQGRDGNLYATTYGGGTDSQGEVVKITPSGTLTVVEANTIQFPYGVTLGTDGNFYGATVFGGTDELGEVYKVTPAGVLTTLHSFTGTDDGDRPVSPPIEGTNGKFYGTTTSASVPNSTAYSVTSTGVFTTLHKFTGPDGQNVYAPLVQGTDGNLYGDTAAGGTSNNGVIFKMTPSGTVTVLHNFAGTDGSGAYYALIQASDGNFYGTTYAGGTAGAGVIFKITSNGTYTVLYNINGSTDGNGPSSSLVQATNGKLYGVTSNINIGDYGTVYSVTTSGTFTTLYSFTGGTDGGLEVSPLRQHTNGLLYGTSEIGGDLNCLSVIDINGQQVEVAGCGTFYTLKIGAKPFVSLVSFSGKEGAKIGILGQGFSSSSEVKFGGVAAASFTRQGTTFLSSTVPAGALTGSVTVTTGATTLTSNQRFRVTPTILNFSPTSGPVGKPVMITGTGLTQTTKVTFGGVAATTFKVNTDSQVTANVPTGAVTGKIVIKTKGGSAASKTDFTVTQ